MRDKIGTEWTVLAKGGFRRVWGMRRQTKVDQEIKRGSTPHVERNWTIKLEYNDLSPEPPVRQRPLVHRYIRVSLLLLEITLVAVSGIRSTAVSVCSFENPPLQFGELSTCFLQFLVDFVLRSFFYLGLEALKT